MHVCRAANYSKTICRCTHGSVWVHRIRGSGGGGVGVRVGGREVGDGTRDTSPGREREGQREWGTHTVSPRSSGFPLRMGHHLFSPRPDVLRVLSFSIPFSPLVSASHSRIASPLPSITRDTSVSRAFRTHPWSVVWFAEKLWLLSPLTCTLPLKPLNMPHGIHT